MPVNRISKAFSTLFLLLAVAFSVSVAVTIWRGQMWTCGFYIGGPRLHLLGIAVSLFGWYFFRHGIQNSRRDWLRCAGRTFLFATSLACALLATEIGLRIFFAMWHGKESMEEFKQSRAQGKPLPFVSEHPLASIIQPASDSRVVYELMPNLDLEFGPVRVRTNKIGLREDHDYPVVRAPNSVRIIGIGDSGMFGWDVLQNETYLSVLESHLPSRSNDVLYEVLNFSVPGYNTRLEVEHLRDKGLAFHPDIVIVGWCENDYSTPYFLLQKQDYARRDVSYVYDLLFNRQRFVTLTPGISFRDQRSLERDRLLPEIISGAEIEGVRSALRDLKAMGAQVGFKILVFGPMKDPTVKLLRELDISYYNTYGEIPGTYPESYLLYFMHPSSDGHRVLAEYLEKGLEARGWLKPANLASGTR